MEESTRKAILQLIREHDGEWGWYQLDRRLSMLGVVAVNVPAAVSLLVDEGLVMANGDLQAVSTRYSITDKGRRTIEGDPGVTDDDEG